MGDGAIRYREVFDGLNKVEIVGEELAYPSAASLVMLAHAQALREQFVKPWDLQPALPAQARRRDQLVDPGGELMAARAGGRRPGRRGRARRPVDVELGPMRRRHLRSVLRIEGQAVHRGWSLGLFMSELANQTGRRYLVAKVGGHGGRLRRDAVRRLRRPRHHHRGRPGLAAPPDRHPPHAGLSREAIERGATALTLEVRASNEAAQAMYRRLGFAPAGIRRNYYADIGEDALVMWAHDVDTPAYAERLDAIERVHPGSDDLIGIGGAVSDPPGCSASRRRATRRRRPWSSTPTRSCRRW